MKRRAQEHEEPENHERWLISYADFITLLFAFFVVMFASSQADKSKAQRVSDSLNAAFDGKHASAVVAAVLGGAPDTKGQGNGQMKGPGGEPRPSAAERKKQQVVELQPSLTILSKELAQEIKSGKIEITMTARGLAISFRQAALFPSGTDEIAPEAMESLGKVAQAIRVIPNPVRLEGHTDSIPIHNGRFKSNWELSSARSIALLTIMTTDFDVPEGRLSVAGYADNAPLVSNETEEGRARNRRVDVIILNENGLQGEPDRGGKPSPER
ncbi:MAG TPA: flagellar motor protein MotB [Bryobacteraceae bacterium]|nr:flagellar motor protein MotB [Bryobacteraceae bacterium]